MCRDLEHQLHFSAYYCCQVPHIVCSHPCFFQLYCLIFFLKLEFPSPLTASTPQYCPLSSSCEAVLGVWTTNQYLTVMYFQSDDDEPSSSGSTAERGEKKIYVEALYTGYNVK